MPLTLEYGLEPTIQSHNRLMRPSIGGCEAQPPCWTVLPSLSWRPGPWWSGGKYLSHGDGTQLRKRHVETDSSKIYINNQNQLFNDFEGMHKMIQGEVVMPEPLSSPVSVALPNTVEESIHIRRSHGNAMAPCVYSR